MTQTASMPSTPALDITSTSRISFPKMVNVELRKSYDTRAGFWLLTSIGGLTVVIMVIFLLAAHSSDRTYVNFIAATGTPQGILLPVLGILLVTSEWGQRTNLTTFTLEPVRSRVIAAKVAAALVLGLVAVAIAIVLAALATVAFGSAGAWDGIGIGDVGKTVLLSELGIVGGLAFGLILLNSAAAIVLSYLLPIVFSVISNLWPWLHKYEGWLDLNTAQGPLQNLDDMSGKDWAHLLTAGLIWVVLPFVAGLIRVSKAEVK